MERYYKKLLLLLDRIPESNFSNSRSELTKIIAEYDAILNELFQSKSLTIKINLGLAKEVKAGWEKDKTYLSATRALKSNINILINLIKPETLSEDLHR
jgi:hypothetical protein